MKLIGGYSYEVSENNKLMLGAFLGYGLFAFQKKGSSLVTEKSFGSYGIEVKFDHKIGILYGYGDFGIFGGVEVMNIIGEDFSYDNINIQSSEYENHYDLVIGFRYSF